MSVVKKRQPPPFQVVPRQAARSLMREIQGRSESEYFGQEAGTPGQGEAPSLVQMPGGRTIDELLHPSFSIFEQLYRALPEEGWFDPNVSPTSPVQFQLGAFEVPKNQALWLFDYEFSVFRPSGVDPGDFVEAARGRFSNVMGFDVTLSGQRKGNLSYQLDPAPVGLTRQEFEAPIGTSRPAAAAAFNRARANSFASTASPGTSLLPVRPNTQGPRGGPFTFIVGEGSQVALNCVIFNTVTAPLAAIQGRQAGYLVHQNLSESLLNRVRPR
jgi:hypothetical protein